MYIDYSTWPEKEIALNSLYLDLKNPRINYTDAVLNQTGIINFLLEKEKVYELAKEISEKGYFVGENPILTEENGKKVVLEGNRRVAALKVLQNPDRYLSRQKAKILKDNIDQNGFDSNKKVKCFISPNRLSANPIIYNRHKGESLKKWKTGNQYSFISDLVYRDGMTLKDITFSLGLSPREVLEPLMAINLFMEGQAILQNQGIEISVQDFEFTNLERFYKNEEGKEFLGVDFNEENGELIINLPREEFEKRCLYIFNQIISTTDFSRKFGNAEEKKLYIQKLKENPEFDFTIRPVASSSTTVSKGKTEENNEKKEEGKREKPKSTRRSTIDNMYYVKEGEELVFNDDKIDALYRELRYTNKSKSYSFSILLRTYLEQTLYFYLTQKGLFDDIGAKEREKKISNDTKKIASLEMYLKKVNKIEGELDVASVKSILKFNDGGTFDGTSLKVMLDYTINNILSNFFSSAEFRVQKNTLNRIKEELDLAVHNYEFELQKSVNKTAWKHLYKFLKALEQDLNESLKEVAE